ncbi:MAG: CBS domain-containing protein [Deltaproteobacteria bacterium]|nr:CBS domain-containing protein [Deltaproteobacteria bacterium]
MSRLSIKAKDAMTSNPRACRADDSLDAAARIMWEEDCGCVPVVDDDGRPIAMLTDRDACMAAFTQGRPLKEIPVSTAMSAAIHTCRVDGAIHDIEAIMRQHKVRRLPVVDEAGKLQGIVSLNDIVRAHEQYGRKTVGGEPLLATLGKIGEHRSGRPSVTHSAE